LTGDVVGTVEATGPGADSALTGTRVAVLLEDAYADYVVADASWLVSVPDGLGTEAASMLPTVGAVALGTLRTGRLGRGETVLVTAGAGAIGHLAVQLARQQGAGTVIATAGSAAGRFAVRPSGQGVSLQSGQTARQGLQVVCVNPAALSGGPATLGAVFPSVQTTSTPWVSYPGLYTARCEHSDGASWPNVSRATGQADHRPTVTENLGPTYGYHVWDLGLAQDNLVSDVAAAEITWSHDHR
jgi:hypothetical protein